MRPAQIDRADRLGSSLPGGYRVREFASLEFPREDYHWVARATRPTGFQRSPSGGPLARLRAWFRAPAEGAADPESTPDAAPA